MPRPLALTPLRQLAVPVVSCALLLAACGGEEKGRSSTPGILADRVVPLTTEQLEDVLLGEAALGQTFTEMEADEEDEDDPTCLSQLGEEFLADRGRDGSYAEAMFASTSEVGLPIVSSIAVSFTSVEEAEERLESYRAALKGCDLVDETDEDGVRTTLDVTVDRTPYTDLVDEQLVVISKGRVIGAIELPLISESSIARVGNNVVFFSFLDFVEDAGDVTRTFSTVLVERLLTVTAGDQPRDVIVTVPDTGDSTAFSS